MTIRFLTLWFGNVHLNGSASNFSVVHTSNTGVCFFIGTEFNESEATSRVEKVSYFTILFNFFLEVFIGSLLTDIMNKDFLSLSLLPIIDRLLRSLFVLVILDNQLWLWFSLLLGLSRFLFFIVIVITAVII